MDSKISNRSYMKEYLSILVRKLNDCTKNSKIYIQKWFNCTKMSETIDEKDMKILEMLLQDSNLSTHKISKKTLIPVTTVLNRIRKLKNLGIIKKYTVEVDKEKLGKTLGAYIFVIVDNNVVKASGGGRGGLLKSILKNPLVESVERVTGNIDIIVKVNTSGIKELNDYVVNTLREYPGVIRTETLIIMSPYAK